MRPIEVSILSLLEFFMVDQAEIFEIKKYAEEINQFIEGQDMDSILKKIDSYKKIIDINDRLQANLAFFIAQGYKKVRMLCCNRDVQYSYLAIFYFQKSLFHFQKIGQIQVGKVLEPLAHELCFQGRYQEAIVIYMDSICANEPWAIIQSARCFYELAHNVAFDEIKINLYIQALKKYENLKKINSEGFINSIDEKKIKWLKSVLSKFGISKSLSEYAKESNEAGYSYKAWLNREKLFLHHLPISAEDLFFMPDFAFEKSTVPCSPKAMRYHMQFDELKNEYCYARYLLYLSMQDENESGYRYNGSMPQVNTLNAPVSNLQSQHLKASFKILYGIFDKIAYFVVTYFFIDKGVDLGRVNFSNIWNEKSLKKVFQESLNPYFKALRHISYEIRPPKPKKGNDKVLLQEELIAYSSTYKTNLPSDIRNAMEHRSFILSEYWPKAFEIMDFVAHEFKDDNSEKNLVMSIDNFSKVVLRLCSVAKSALLSLSCAIEYENSMGNDEYNNSVTSLSGLEVDFSDYTCLVEVPFL